MRTLYLLGGSPRSGKSTIMKRVVSQAPMPFLASDAMEDSFRYVLVGNKFRRLVGKASFKGSVETNLRGMPIEKVHFSKKGEIHDLLREAILGVISYYERYESNLAIEGQLITPEWVSKIQSKEFKIKAAFVGFTDSNHVENILSHARKTPSDWINWWHRLDPNALENIRSWANALVLANRKLAKSAESKGYPFFDLSAGPFTDHVKQATAYFLEK